MKLTITKIFVSWKELWIHLAEHIKTTLDLCLIIYVFDDTIRPLFPNTHK